MQKPLLDRLLTSDEPAIRYKTRVQILKENPVLATWNIRSNWWPVVPDEGRYLEISLRWGQLGKRTCVQQAGDSPEQESQAD